MGIMRMVNLTYQKQVNENSMAHTPYLQKAKPPFPYERILSWSQLSSFKYSPYKWYMKYVIGEEEPPNPAMIAGKLIGERLAEDPLYLPDVERAETFEQELKGTIENIKLIGFLDSFSLEKKVLLEYKTSKNKSSWSQKKAESHGQLDMYAYLIYQTYGIKPEELTIKLISITVDEEGIPLEEPPRVFEVKKTIEDVLIFANEVVDIRNEMLAYYNSK